MRIPRRNLLGGVATVSPSGDYSRVPGGEKRMYGAMLDVRANIVANASRALAKAATVAVRYSHARRQGYRDGSGGEVPVLEHPTQLRGVVPWVALAYALHFTGARFSGQYAAFLAGKPPSRRTLTRIC